MKGERDRGGGRGARDSAVAIAARQREAVRCLRRAARRKRRMERRKREKRMRRARRKGR